MTTEELQSLKKRAASLRQEYDRKVARVEAHKETINEAKEALREAGCETLAAAEARIESLQGEIDVKTEQVRELLA